MCVEGAAQEQGPSFFITVPWHRATTLQPLMDDTFKFPLKSEHCS